MDVDVQMQMHNILAKYLSEVITKMLIWKAQQHLKQFSPGTYDTYEKCSETYKSRQVR